jgi:cob(I)alamin adenosyltransferase
MPFGRLTWGGVRLAKDEARMEAIGSVDELKAAIGFAAAVQQAGCFNDGDLVPGLLESVQQDLLVAGTETGARLYLARAVCRRAERRLTTLRRNGNVSPDVCIYLNRLGDLLFILARYVNHVAAAADIIWAPRA